MLSTSIVILISSSAIQIFALDESCVTTNNDQPIDNCCDLGYRQTQFSDIVNKPKVYKFKNFCNNCLSPITRGYCDTLTDRGGWLVVQRRKNGTDTFHRSWTEYEIGFGSLTGELWYGLRALHCLTRRGKWELRIDFTFSNGTKSYMHYNHFRVGSPTDNYTLSISEFIGITPTDPFTVYPLNGQAFTTYDRDNDKWSGNCAVDGYAW